MKASKFTEAQIAFMLKQAEDPTAIRVDQGLALILQDLWADQKGVILDLSRRGKPTDNHASRNGFGSIGPFNGKFPAECLNAHWFMSLKPGKFQRRRQQIRGAGHRG